MASQTADGKANEAEYLREIGDVTVRLSGLEIVIETLIWNLLGNTRGAPIVTSYLQFKTLCDVAENLVEKRYPQDYAEIAPLMKDARKRAEERNSIVHDIWVISEDSSAVADKLRLNRGRFGATKVPIGEITKVRDGILQTTRGVMEFMVRHKLNQPMDFTKP